MRQLGLPMAALEEQFRRMTFNIIARNQDDHVKNISFLMDRVSGGCHRPMTSPGAITRRACGPHGTRWR